MEAELPIAVFDIDGVVADVRHRLQFVERKPKDWSAFFAAAKNDGAHRDGIEMVQKLSVDHEVVYLTGRPKQLRRDTEAWLESHGIGGHRLVMRQGGDRRPAATVKVEFLRKLAKVRTVALVVDDDDAVISAVKAAGFTTHHATWEKRKRGEQLALEVAQEEDGRT